MGYELTSGHVINNLLYMDNLKLFAKTEKEIKSLLNSVTLFSSNIDMQFGIAKCAHVGIQRDRIYASGGIALPSGDVIKSLSFDETYKYFGGFENFISFMKNSERKSVLNTINKSAYSIIKIVCMLTINSGLSTHLLFP